MKQRHLLLIALLMPVLCSARTWRVEKDGSAEFTNIQPAVDMASPRDTVLVGPGRYDEFWLFNPVLHWEVIVGVRVDSLTIIGTDRDAVIIGPTTLYPPVRAGEELRTNISIGIAAVGGAWGVIENLTIENTWRGIELYPSGIIRNCTIRGTWDMGILADKALWVLIDGCSTYMCGDGISIYAYGNGQDIITVANCRTEGSQTGYYISHPNAVIEDCMAIGCNTGYGVVAGRVRMNNIIADGCYGGIGVEQAEITQLTNAIVKNSIQRDMFVYTGGIIVGSDVLLCGDGAGQTIRVSNGRITLHESHIMPSNGISVYIQYHNGPDDVINLTENFWGTTSADSIASWIWDSHDDPSILTTVRYEPFSPTPLSNENRSMGDVKAMFRR